jgi:hypothetical protein
LCLIETAKQDLKENKEVFLCFLYWEKKGNRKGTADLLGESLGNASAFWCVMTTFAHWNVRPLDVSARGNLLINIRTVNSRAGAKKNSSSSFSSSSSSFCSSHSLQRYAKFGSSSASRCSKLHRVGVRSFGQEQQQQQKHRSSEEEVVMAVAMAGCAAAAAHAAPLKLEKVVLTKEHLSLVCH